MISGGWPAVLSSLKSFLETGKGLEPTWVEEEKPGSNKFVACDVRGVLCAARGALEVFRRWLLGRVQRGHRQSI